MSRVLAGRPLLAFVHHPQLQQLCYYVRNQNSICYHLVQEQEGLGHEQLVLWQIEHRGIKHGACFCDLFLLDLSCRNNSNVIFYFSPDHWNGKWHTLLLPFSHPSSSLHMFYSKRGERMAYLDPLVWLHSNRNTQSSKCQWFLFVRKNHMTADITEPVKTILTLPIQIQIPAEKTKKNQKKQTDLQWTFELIRVNIIILDWNRLLYTFQYIFVSLWKRYWLVIILWSLYIIEIL